MGLPWGNSSNMRSGPTSVTGFTGSIYSADERSRQGFETGVRHGFLRDDFANYVSAEFDYLYHDGHPFLQAPDVDIQGQSHTLTGQKLVHFKPRKHRWRPFVAGGFEARNYVTAGLAPFPQPIPQIASLTTNDVWKVVFSVGGGMKCRVRPHLQLRGGPRLLADVPAAADRSG